MTVQSRVIAAGTLTTRRARNDGRAIAKQRPVEVLVVHRPKYDDWSFPKGKLDAYEHPTTAAVRETAEETGIDVRLGPPLPPQTYPLDARGQRRKIVHYWTARVVGDDDVSGYRPNAEIDEVAWVPADKARKLLTYAHDRETLDLALTIRKRSAPLIVLRHGKARARSTWRTDDTERPLTKLGEFQAEQLVPILAAYGVSRLVSSSSRRCWTTLGPYADVTGHDLEETRWLSEEEATLEEVTKLVDALLAAKEPTVLCTHRPVLPLAWKALGIPEVPLEPGSLAVIHHRRQHVVATEVHAAPSGR
ncbi:MAG: NUDIX hydrolase [Nocardioidaceae bacterium]